MNKNNIKRVFEGHKWNLYYLKVNKFDDTKRGSKFTTRRTLKNFCFGNMSGDKCKKYYANISYLWYL